MHSKSFIWTLVAGAIALLAACGSSDDLGSVCTSQPQSGALVIVVDAAGVAIPSADVTYSYQGGPFLKGFCGGGQCLVGSASGPYTLRTASPGYISREDVIQVPASTSCLPPEFTIVLTRQ
jgi:hypothetical protein